MFRVLVYIRRDEAEFAPWHEYSEAFLKHWPDILEELGVDRLVAQVAPDSPDVVCSELGWIHFEVKAVERLNIEDAMEQARRDAAKCEVRGPKSERGPKGEIRKVPVVAHRRGFRRWLVTMEAETFFRLLRGDLTEGSGGNEERTEGTRRTKGTDGTNGKPEISDFKGPSGPESNNNTQQKAAL